ncbi:hypothetical protein L7F22_034668 [Adiantum nelumboides]|nr:hypothetical protein [Adiantum nelumboides]
MEEKEVGATKRWLNAHKGVFLSATRSHPFIVSIRDGTIDLENFKRWLGQDYFFVRSFARFVASVLVKLPKDARENDVDLVLGGMSALEQEIAWFRSEASKWGVQLGSLTLQKANLNYCRFLEELTDSCTHHAVILVAFWAIEMVYNESFAACLEVSANTPVQLRDACERWGNAEFKAYCMGLQKLADNYIQMSPTNVQKEAEQAFLNVLSFEVDFWNMSSQP